MDMQNVKSLEIPEGYVKTIHDKNSRLLWGAVGYDTKYAGDTFQQTYSGKNKINGAYSEISQTVRCSAEASGNGFKITSTSSSGATYVTVPIPNITSLLDQTVTLSYSASGSGVRIGFFYLNSSGAATGNISYTQTTTLPSSLDSNAGIGVVFYTSNNGSATYADIQLEIGSTATTYEPYTGGIPAPNPDYPQDIQVVTGEQTVTISDGVSSQSYAIDLTGKNLLDITTFENGYINSSGTVSGGGGTNAVFGFMPVLPETDYTVSVQNNSFAMAIAYYDSNKTLISRVTNDYVGRTSRTFTTPQNCAYARAGFYAGSGASQSIMEEALPQFEKGSTATSYAPYFTPIELCKIGTYQDYIYKSGDDWYVHKEVVKISPNGTEEWKTTSSQPPTGQFYVYTTDFDSIVKTKWYSGLVGDNFTMWGGTPSWLTPTTIVNGAVFSNSDASGAAALRIMFPSSIVSSVETAKTWFALNLPVFYYPIATPTDTKITDATLIGQLNAVHEWLTRYGYNSTVTGNLPIIIDRTNL